MRARQLWKITLLWFNVRILVRPTVRLYIPCNPQHLQSTVLSDYPHPIYYLLLPSCDGCLPGASFSTSSHFLGQHEKPTDNV